MRYVIGISLTQYSSVRKEENISSKGSYIYSTIINSEEVLNCFFSFLKTSKITSLSSSFIGIVHVASFAVFLLTFFTPLEGNPALNFNLAVSNSGKLSYI